MALEYHTTHVRYTLRLQSSPPRGEQDTYLKRFLYPAGFSPSRTTLTAMARYLLVIRPWFTLFCHRSLWFKQMQRIGDMHLFTLATVKYGRQWWVRASSFCQARQRFAFGSQCIHFRVFGVPDYVPCWDESFLWPHLGKYGDFAALRNAAVVIHF